MPKRNTPDVGKAFQTLLNDQSLKGTRCPVDTSVSDAIEHEANFTDLSTAVHVRKSKDIRQSHKISMRHKICLGKKCLSPYFKPIILNKMFSNYEDGSTFIVILKLKTMAYIIYALCHSKKMLIYIISLLDKDLI